MSNSISPSGHMLHVFNGDLYKSIFTSYLGKKQLSLFTMSNIIGPLSKKLCSIWGNISHYASAATKLHPISITSFLSYLIKFEQLKLSILQSINRGDKTFKSCEFLNVTRPNFREKVIGNSTAVAVDNQQFNTKFHSINILSLKS